MTGPPSRRRAGLAVRVGVGTMLVLAVMALFVLPVRTYLGQRHQLAVSAAHLHLLNSQNRILTGRIDALQTDAEIERIAREQYHLVRPGEQAFVIEPAPNAAAVAAPLVVPRAPARSGFWQRSWHRLTSFL
jgi:hypothetical protein